LKNLALSSLFLLLSSSCSLILVNDFQPAQVPAAGKTDTCSWFREDTGRFLYQSSIDIFRNNFSGILFIKPLGDESHRILFITEVGIKIFDLEFFKNDDLKVHYCIEELNRKSLIKILGNDLFLVLNNIAEEGRIKMMQEKNTGRMIIKSKDQYGTRYCVINEKTNKVEELIQTGFFSNKLNIRFFSTSGVQPDSINISHYNLKLKIHLSKINEN